MLRKQSLQQQPLLYSVLLHLLVLAAFIVSFDFHSPMPVFENTNKTDVINAMVIQSAPVVNQRKRIPLPAPPAPIVKPQPTPPPKPITKPQEVTPAVKQAIAIPDKKQKQIKEDLLQKQLLADLKKQTVTKKNQQRQKTLEADFAKEMKELKSKSLEQQMAQEKQRLEGVQSQQMRGIVDKYRALILQAIGQRWLVPHGADRTLTAELLIRVAPGGMVLDVQLIKSSGDDSLDRSARAAVFKASPLPVPTNANEFEPFRQFVLKVKPENIINNG